MTTTYHLNMLLTDWILYGLLVLVIGYALWARKKQHLRDAWRHVFTRPLGMMAVIVLGLYIVIGLLDCIHFTVNSVDAKHQQVHTATKSVLDIIINPLGQYTEKTYSAPFATQHYNASIVQLPDGTEKRGFAPLQHVSTAHDIAKRAWIGLGGGVGSFTLLLFMGLCIAAWRRNTALCALTRQLLAGNTQLAWRTALLTFSILWIMLWVIALLATHYHILGTDKVGRDVFYESISSIRTGLVIGTLATLFMLPFALILGMMAGYFQGWTDDVIQYLYTTLSAIPGVLLISAAILVLQVYISNHPQAFLTLRDRADARLLALCLILGVTSWASLCRLLRGETLKVRQLAYVEAAHALGVRPFRILFRHVMPNVMHIVLITIALDFSNLVLAEAVLSYVGVGVDPTTVSWGNMINASRLELAREPVVWWPLASALVLMFVLILAANIFSDTLRDAFDPKVGDKT